MMEARQQVKDTSGCPEGSALLQEAMDNISATWEELLELVVPKKPSVLFKMKNFFKNKFSTRTDNRLWVNKTLFVVFDEN